MQRVSSSSLARSRSLGVAALPSSSSTFSTFLGAVNSNTLGFLREKLLTHDVEAGGTRTRASKKQGAGAGEGLVPVSRELHRNIFFNSNERSALRHVELTKEFIRLEFSEPNEEYRKHANLLFASEAERSAQGVPQWLVPVALQNNEHCGGGATILLDKRNVYESLLHPARRSAAGQH